MPRNLKMTALSDVNLQTGNAGMARARDGGVFDPSSEIWSFRTARINVNMNFGRAAGMMPELKCEFKAMMHWFLENESDYVASAHFEGVLRFLKVVTRSGYNPIEQIKDIHILSYHAHLGIERQWHLSQLSGFLKKWHSLGFGGVAPSAIDLLKQLTLKGSVKGKAVRTMDPIVGPFSDLELEGIQLAATNALASGDLDIEGAALVWLCMAFGPRPVQIAMLKICDFKVISADDGTLSYFLMMPRGKQRQIRPRSQFTERALAPQIGELIARHIEDLKKNTLRLARRIYIACQFSLHSTRAKNRPMAISTTRPQAILRMHCRPHWIRSVSFPSGPENRWILVRTDLEEQSARVRPWKAMAS